jgi:hypothetical protein
VSWIRREGQLDSFCIAENEIIQRPIIPVKGNPPEGPVPMKKRKFAGEALPPRPSGPPPSWAFKSAGLKIELDISKKDDCRSVDLNAMLPNTKASTST